MAPARSKVCTSSWDQADKLLREITRGKNIIIGADHQRGHRDAMEFLATVESQNGVEPTRLDIRRA